MFKRKNYSGKKFDCSAFIDIRNYNKPINIMPFLLEPMQTHLLNTLPNQGQIVIFKQTIPWVVLNIFESSG